MILSVMQKVNCERLQRCETRIREVIKTSNLPQYKRNELAEVAKEIRIAIQLAYGLTWNVNTQTWLNNESDDQHTKIPCVQP